MQPTMQFKLRKSGHHSLLCGFTMHTLVTGFVLDLSSTVSPSPMPRFVLVGIALKVEVRDNAERTEFIEQFPVVGDSRWGRLQL